MDCKLRSDIVRPTTAPGLPTCDYHNARKVLAKRHVKEMLFACVVLLILLFRLTNFIEMCSFLTLLPDVNY